MSTSNSMPDVTGSIIHDHYQLVEMLGSGSYGVVYKAIDLEVDDDSNNIVALKIMRLANRSEKELAAIEREVIMHSEASGIEGVVTLLDSFDDEMWCCLVMEYCSGGDLFDQSIHKQTYVGNDELLKKAFVSLVDAVQACHELGIAHRDLKLENVFTSEDGSRCFLGDFTLATNEPMVCEFGVGTRRYMSPECIGRMTHKEPYDPYLSDVWSLGIILCAMATGGHPWRRATYNDHRYTQFLEDPDFLHDWYGISTGAQDIIQCLLAPFPDARLSLPALRQAVLALDTFFRPGADSVEAQGAQGEEGREREYTAVMRLEIAREPTAAYAYASMVPEIDILCGAPGLQVRSPWDSSAGSAMDVDGDVDMDGGAPDARFWRSDSCSSSLSAHEAQGSGGQHARANVFSLDRPITLTAHVLWDEVMEEDRRKELSGSDDEW